jgi:sterol desaturase/sphingolipid hydroxylase (fatty acid hydroxylase superfamily)
MKYSLLTLFLRYILSRIMLTGNYICVDKNNPENLLSQRQIELEGSNQTFHLYIHFATMLFLELVFPNMYSDTNILLSAWYTLLCHIFVNEPLYYVFHYYLHEKYMYTRMHGVHHSSVKTIPTTTALQNKVEHVLYIGVFAPAMLFPYIFKQTQCGIVIMLYLLLFDLVNSFGHLRINMPKWYAKSFLKYVFYQPIFHINHHLRHKCNYSLFMPIVDIIGGTYYEDNVRIKDVSHQGQDFLFIGHNGGWNHLFNMPEINFYNIYKPCGILWNSPHMDFFLIDKINLFIRLAGCRTLKLACYKIVSSDEFGRVISLTRTPLDYLNKYRFNAINNDLLDVITAEYNTNKTMRFGLGNLNKMKELNNGGAELIGRLPSPDILLWTGDSMTCASIYNYIIDNEIDNIFYIGGTGKIGQMVCKLLAKHNIRITLYSANIDRANEIVRYNAACYTTTDDLANIDKYTNIFIGKMTTKLNVKHKNIYDYTVLFIPIPNNNHIQIAIIKNSSNSLSGYYDMCFGLSQTHLYACYCGCIINFIEKRDKHEVGDIEEQDVIDVWNAAKKLGFDNAH